jgi:hypothetical protein
MSVRVKRQFRDSLHNPKAELSSRDVGDIRLVEALLRCKGADVVADMMLAVFSLEPHEPEDDWEWGDEL